MDLGKRNPVTQPCFFSGIPLHDRQKTTVYGCQVGFINFMCLPLVKAWVNLLQNFDSAKEIQNLMESNSDTYKKKSQPAS